MPYWKKLVHERLQKLSLPPERKQEIVNEIAGHMEDVNEERLQEGISEKAALEQAALSFPAWESLSHSIQQIELQEGTMNYRTKTLWLPGLATLSISFAILVWSRLAGLEPGVVRLGRSLNLELYYPWLFILPVLGTLGAPFRPCRLRPPQVNNRHTGVF